jgi:4-hydroxy-3-polyprenylbenzoate decarboxylase
MSSAAERSTTADPRAPLILAITGASGAPYAVRLLEQLVIARQPVWLIVSSHGFRLLQTESDIASLDALRARTGGALWEHCVRVFDDTDRGAPPASGSALTRGMVICPCSMGTVSAIAHGSSRSLIERAADVMLKERRPLIVMPRETPLSTVHLKNLLTLSEMGVVVTPAAPGFYHRPEAIVDIVDFVVARMLDQLGIAHGLGKRWGQV